MTFEELSLSKPLLQAVTEAGYEQPSPIQQKAIPPVLAGRDLLGCAQTGTGKTAAFALPILQLLAARKPEKKGAIRALILTPTRELALQIYESFEAYGRHLQLRCTVMFGGVGQQPQVDALRRGVDILVATPGRLNDLIGQGYVKLGHVEIFVLDEADRMLDMGFVQDVKKVLKFMPQKKQTLLFSATMPKEIVQLAAGLLYKPAKVFVTPPATTVEKIDQTLYKVDKGNKRHLLAALLRRPGVESALVFTRTKHGADRVVRELKREDITALAIHGNKSQTARQNALTLFKKGKVKVLVATDIAARGLDISELSHVFNYDLPNIPETYVHRIGRTGRAGRGGIAISFCCADELEYLADIEKLIGFTIPEQTDHAWPMQVFELTDKKQAAKQPGGKPARPAPAQPRAPKQPQPAARQQQKNVQQAASTPATGTKQARHPSNQKQQAPQPTAPTQPQPGTTGSRATGQQAAPARGGKKSAQSPGKRGQRPPLSNNPYENRTGGAAIITKRPVWSTQPPAGGDAPQNEGDDDMSRNNRRRRGGKNRSGKAPEGAQSTAPQQNPAKAKPPAIKKNERGVFDFSEKELAEDTSLRLIGDETNNGENKFASFEDFLKSR